MRTHVGVLLVLGLATASLSAQITTERLANAASEPQQWMMIPGAYDGSRFSPLDQINRTNVQRLSLKWVFQTGVRGPHETTPLVIDGIMYLTTPQNHAYAVDTRTGRPLWHYQRTLPKEMSLCCGRVNRGVAVLGDHVFMGTIDGHLTRSTRRAGRVWDIAAADADKGYGFTWRHSSSKTK